MTHKDQAMEVQAIGITKLFSEITPEIFPNLGKGMKTQVQEAYRTPSVLNQKRMTVSL